MDSKLLVPEHPLLYLNLLPVLSPYLSLHKDNVVDLLALSQEFIDLLNLIVLYLAYFGSLLENEILVFEGLPGGEGSGCSSDAGEEVLQIL
jgi:hypothetical protein